MRALHCLCLFTSFLGFMVGSTEAVNDVRFPELKPMPAPMPPVVTPTLSGDYLYVIDSDSPVVVLTAPAGLVSVSEEPGPLSIKGKFVGGSGFSERKTFRGKQVFIVEGVRSGDVEVIVVPLGLKTGGEITRKKIRVITDTQPAPTPKDDPVIPPDTVPALFPGDGLRVYVVFESEDLPKYPAAQVNAMSAGVVREYLNSKVPVGPDGKTYEYRFFDQNVVPDVPAFAAVHKKTRATLPWVYISNGKPGAANNYDGPLPADTHAFLALLKRIGG